MNHDRIEKEIFIAVSLKTVWAVVSEPAWWVGDAPGPDSVQVDGTKVVAETRFGTFTVLTEQIDPPSYLACRWASSFPGEEPREGNSTRIEFTLTEKDGGTLVRVVESGFSNLDVPEEDQLKYFEGNVKGWDYELGVLRQRTEK